jgi:glycosyltransferase involved in cell wall biosynthesis
MTENIKNVVVIYDFAYQNGGAAKIAIDTALGLAERGKRVIYFAAVSPIDERFQNKVNVVCLNQNDILQEPNKMKAAYQGIWNHQAAKCLKEVLAGLDPKETIIHIHGWSKALSGSIFPIIRKSGFRFVTTLHDYFLVCPNGGLYNYQKNEICPYKGGSWDCFLSNCDKRSVFQKYWRFLRFLIEKYIAKLEKDNQYIAVSQFQADIITHKLGNSSGFKVLPNPIPLSSEVVNHPADNYTYFYVGRLTPEKGVDLFADAVHQLNLKAIIVGEGECKNLLKEQYPEIQFINWLNQAELKQKLKQARCLIFPSRWYECAPLVPREVIMMGIPVIASDKSAAVEIVEDLFSGLLFSSGDSSDLMKKLELCENDDFVSEINHNILQIKQNLVFSLDDYFNQLFLIYQ